VPWVKVFEVNADLQFSALREIIHARLPSAAMKSFSLIEKALFV
jgi:hypothetical protein